MESILLLLFLIMFCQIEHDLACQAARRKAKTPVRQHWTVPENDKVEYKNWIADYKKNQSILKKIDKKSKLPKGMIVPETWKGYGAGFTGQDPPPWAIVKGMQGKPDYCFGDPQKGHCNNVYKRWGYNSFAKQCQQFTYSGCGGNLNNFNRKSQCEKVCNVPVQAKCQKSQDYPEYDINDYTYKQLPNA